MERANLRSVVSGVMELQHHHGLGLLLLAARSAAAGDLQPSARQKAACLAIAASTSTSTSPSPAAVSSSPTASPQRPHSHRPPYRARTPAAYVGVHSSLSPQHAHSAHSTSTTAATTTPELTSCPAAAAADMSKKLSIDPQSQRKEAPRNNQRIGYRRCYSPAARRRKRRGGSSMDDEEEVVLGREPRLVQLQRLVVQGARVFCMRRGGGGGKACECGQQWRERRWWGPTSK
uniref:Uncharacterized protein n=1 Tax=Oryza punctata TaxID=4537 RepID=A0A0E0K9M5_ORYPU